MDTVGQKKAASYMMKNILCATVLGLAAIMPLAAAHASGTVEIGGVLHDTQMRGLSGPSRKLSSFYGKPLVINVWASWCGPCRQEMGSLERLSHRTGGGQFNVIGISTDDYRDQALGFLKQSKTTFTNFIDHDVILENMLGADRIPLTVLVDAQGRVLDKFYGANEWDSPEAIETLRKAFRIKM
jgi:thiol-disulfide isomerase/thioredoxin